MQARPRRDLTPSRQPARPRRTPRRSRRREQRARHRPAPDQPRRPLRRRRRTPPGIRRPDPGPAARQVTGTVVRLSASRAAAPAARRDVVRGDLPSDAAAAAVGGEALDECRHRSTVVAQLGTAEAAGTGVSPVAAAASWRPPPPASAGGRGPASRRSAPVLPPGARPDATTSPASPAPERPGRPVLGGADRRQGAVPRGAGRPGWTRVRSRCDDAWSLWAEVARRVGFVPGPLRHLLVLVPATVPGCYARARDDRCRALGRRPGLRARHPDRSRRPRARSQPRARPLQRPAVRRRVRRHLRGRGLVGRVRRRGLPGLVRRHGCQLGTPRHAEHGAGLPAGRSRRGVRGHRQGPVRATLTAVGERAGLRSLRIDLGGTTYVVEYRAAVGADAWLGSDWRGLAPGVLVRRSDPDGGGQTLLLDGTPSPPRDSPRTGTSRCRRERRSPPPAGGSSCGSRPRPRPRRTSPSRSTACGRRPAWPGWAHGWGAPPSRVVRAARAGSADGEATATTGRPRTPIRMPGR